MADVPTWLETYVRAWVDRFSLQGWEITIHIERVVDDDQHCMGHAKSQPNYNRATLTFREDIDDTAEWRKVVIHELVHVVMARVDTFVYDAILPAVTFESERVVATNGYTQHAESYVQSLAVALYWCSRWKDYPDEYPDDA